MEKMRRNGKGTLLKAIAISIMYVSGVPLLAQSVLYAPSSSNSEAWVCLDQYYNPIPYAYFQVWTGSYLYTNYHYHYSPSPPSSTPSPSSGYADYTGTFTFNLNTTLVGHAEYEQLYCSNGNGSA